MKKKISKITMGEMTGDVIYPVKWTPAQQKEADKELREARKKTRQNITETDRLELKLWQLRFQLEASLKNDQYDPKMTFGHFLKEYVTIFNIKRKTLAEEISIDETLLSQLINMHREPPDYLVVRLEIHSNNIIPANYWYKLVGRQKEYYIKTDKGLRRKERKFVHNRVAAGV
jgi:hypothetical protein